VAAAAAGLLETPNVANASSSPAALPGAAGAGKHCRGQVELVDISKSAFIKSFSGGLIHFFRAKAFIRNHSPKGVDLTKLVPVRISIAFTTHQVSTHTISPSRRW
jgi:hypothetical protein